MDLDTFQSARCIIISLDRAIERRWVYTGQMETTKLSGAGAEGVGKEIEGMMVLG